MGFEVDPQPIFTVFGVPQAVGVVWCAYVVLLCGSFFLFGRFSEDSAIRQHPIVALILTAALLGMAAILISGKIYETLHEQAVAAARARDASREAPE